MRPELRPFLNVHILWHAQAGTNCRTMADALFTLLSSNRERPFAREIGIPTCFRTRPDGWPGSGPVDIDLDAAAHNVVFALVESRGLNNGLDRKENLALFELQDIKEAVWLILRSMTRRWPAGAA